MSELDTQLQQIGELDNELEECYREQLVVNTDLDRRLVSFQANKSANGHRWCKYKEGFSADLIRYVLDAVSPKGRLIDPFAGSGTTLFVGAERGFDTLGIELLPSSAEIIELRRDVQLADSASLADQLREFVKRQSWVKRGKRKTFQVLPITNGAYPDETLKLLERYLHDADSAPDPLFSRMLRFGALCILESISYTRKDGQYLRWDYRSRRRQGAKKFDKGEILGFTDAITQKLRQIADDLDSEGLLFEFKDDAAKGEIELKRGSCLDVLPTLKARSFGGLITSPPYCNRYDYTRTYALELAMLGADEQQIKDLRQAMVSCTVENRFKEGIEDNFTRQRYNTATRAFEEQELLQTILGYLNNCREQGTLNNTGIPRMVHNYFREMALVIAECSRILKPGAPFVMVNDNVRYQGAHVPVDLILSDIAKSVGFDVETIWALPKGKGNSSQQMGKHGRIEIRKCVYVWRRSKTTRAKSQDQQVALER